MYLNMSIFHNLKNEKEYKASTGFNSQEFNELFIVFQTLYTPKESNPYLPIKLQPVLTNKKEALFFILHYLKAYPTLQNMGLYFGFSEATVSQYLELLKPIIKASLTKLEHLTTRLFKDQTDFDKAFEGIEELAIDVTEIPIQRPDNQEVQKNNYSGKKKPIQ